VARYCFAKAFCRVGAAVERREGGSERGCTERNTRQKMGNKRNVAKNGESVKCGHEREDAVPPMNQQGVEKDRVARLHAEVAAAVEGVSSDIR
jgi:hypothetical protein